MRKYKITLEVEITDILYDIKDFTEAEIDAFNMANYHQRAKTGMRVGVKKVEKIEEDLT